MALLASLAKGGVGEDDGGIESPLCANAPVPPLQGGQEYLCSHTLIGALRYGELFILHRIPATSKPIKTPKEKPSQ